MKTKHSSAVYRMSQDLAVEFGHLNRGIPSISALYSTAPETAAERDRLKEINAELLEALEGMSGVITTMRRDYRPEDLWALLDKWNEKARVAIAKSTGGED